MVASLAGVHEEETSVEAVAFSPHLPSAAISAGMDGKLVVWDLAATSARTTCQHPEVCAGVGAEVRAGGDETSSSHTTHE